MCPRRYRKAPDGGWGWAIVAGSFVVHFLVLGTQYSFGVLFNALLDAFPNKTRADVAWTSSLSLSLMLGFSSVTARLVKRFGCRAVCIAGGVVVAASLFAASYAEHLEVLYPAFAMVGVGFSMSFNPAVVIIAHYFVKHRALATGIAVAGSGVGTFGMAPIYNSLIKAYGWRVALRVVGPAAGVLIVASGATFMPIGMSAGAAARAVRAAVKMRRLVGSPASVAPVGDGAAAAAGDADPDATVSTPATAPPSNPGTPVTGAAVVAADSPQEVAVRQAMLDVEAGRESKASPVGDNGTQAAGTGMGCGAGSAPEAAADAAGASKQLLARSASGTGAGFTNAKPDPLPLDTRVWTHPQLRKLLIASVLGSIGYFVPFVLVVRYSKDVGGLSSGQGTAIVAVVGIMSTVGRVVFGRIGDLGLVRLERLYVVSVFLTGFSIMAMSISADFWPLIACGVMLGLFAGSFIALISPVTARVVGMVMFPQALGAMYSVQVLSVLLGPPAAGWLVEAMNDTYTAAFLAAGGFIVVSGVPLLSLKIPDENPALVVEDEEDDEDVKGALATVSPGAVAPVAT